MQPQLFWIMFIFTSSSKVRCQLLVPSFRGCRGSMASGVLEDLGYKATFCPHQDESERLWESRNWFCGVDVGIRGQGFMICWKGVCITLRMSIASIFWSVLPQLVFFLGGFSFHYKFTRGAGWLKPLTAEHQARKRREGLENTASDSLFLRISQG